MPMKNDLDLESSIGTFDFCEQKGRRNLSLVERSLGRHWTLGLATYGNTYLFRLNIHVIARIGAHLSK